MGTIPLRLVSVVPSRGQATSLLQKAGDAVLVERGSPRLLVLACPCGCGEQFPVNLDPRSGPAWHLYKKHGSISVFPSVWRESGCRSHYIIWRSKILLFGAQQSEELAGASGEYDALTETILPRLPSRDWVPFGKLAELVDAVPWDVLVACRILVREGKAFEGIGKQRGEFRRV